VKLEIPRSVEIYGAVRINEVQRIYEISPGCYEEEVIEGSIVTPSHHRISDIENKMAIIVPIMGENLKLLEGILTSIPTESLVIVVSNSELKPIDLYRMEVETVQNFCNASSHRSIMVHQKDAKIASALKAAGYTSILDNKGLIRNGKGEAMVLGLILAKLFNKQYVGFIDADNYVPSTAYEYIQCFATGFSIAKTPYSMVRVSWGYKPKISEDGLYFKKRGRVSEITNNVMNRLIADLTGFRSEIIKTGNAGEHALSLRLAELLSFASGFAIEPYEIINILEMFGLGGELSSKKPVKEGVEILQIDSRSPHFHDNKGGEHLERMLVEGLASIFHSKLCKDNVKNEILEEFRSRQILSSGDEIPKPKIMDPIITMDFEKFQGLVKLGKGTINAFNINTEIFNLQDIEK
jgi:mannosyl-3-phosphoglycerate synthase